MKIKYDLLLFLCLFSFLLASERSTDNKHLKQADAVPLSAEEKQVHHRLFSGDKLYPGAISEDFDFGKRLSLDKKRDRSSSASKKFSRSEKLRNNGNTNFMRAVPNTSTKFSTKYIEQSLKSELSATELFDEGYYPQVAVAENGDIYVVYNTYNSEITEYLMFYIYKSSDGGEIWTYEGYVYNSSRDVYTPDIEVVDDRMIVLYEEDVNKLGFFMMDLEAENWEFSYIEMPENVEFQYGSITSDKFYYGFDDTWIYITYIVSDTTMDYNWDIYYTMTPKLESVGSQLTEWSDPIKLTNGDVGAFRPGIAIAYSTDEAYDETGGEFVVTTWRDTLYNGYAGRVNIYTNSTDTEIVMPSESGTEGWGTYAPAVAAYWDKVFITSMTWWGEDLEGYNVNEDVTMTFSEDEGVTWGTDDDLWWYWGDDEDESDWVPTPAYSVEGVLGFAWQHGSDMKFRVNSTGEFLQGWEASKVFDSDIGSLTNEHVYMIGSAIDSTTFHIMYDTGDDFEIYYHSEKLVGSGTGTISGRVTSALDGSAIEGAKVLVGKNEAYSGSDGSFSVENVLPGFVKANFIANVTSGEIPLTVEFYDLSTVGAREITATKDDFMEYVNRDVIVIPGETTVQDISLTPALSAGQYRIVLNWGSVPEDLDAHLITPVIEGLSHHLYWDNMGSESETPYAALDIDDIDSFGPETISIYTSKPGTYSYFVHNYSMSDGQATAVDFDESDASIQIYSDEGQILSMSPPRKGSSGVYWYVADIDGVEGGIKVINELQDDAPGSAMSSGRVTQNQVKSRALNRTRPATDLSYSWDFGDGKKSTQTEQQHPTYVYKNNGTWDVTLTVSDGANSSTEVFEQYIVSGTGSISEELLLPESFTLHQNYPNPFNPTTTISYDLPEQALVTLGIYDILGKQIKTLVNQSQDAGNKTTFWNGTDNLGRQVSAGVYLYQIQAGEFTQTRKMLLLK